MFVQKRITSHSPGTILTPPQWVAWFIDVQFVRTAPSCRPLFEQHQAVDQKTSFVIKQVTSTIWKNTGPFISIWLHYNVLRSVRYENLRTVAKGWVCAQIRSESQCAHVHSHAHYSSHPKFLSAKRGFCKNLQFSGAYLGCTISSQFIGMHGDPRLSGTIGYCSLQRFFTRCIQRLFGKYQTYHVGTPGSGLSHPFNAEQGFKFTSSDQIQCRNFWM